MKIVKGCYAACLGECGGRLSGEHYFSQVVLRTLWPSGVVDIEGLKWVRPERPPSINSLTANILCEHHNQLLSNLDAEAGKIFQFFDEAIPNVRNDKARLLEVAISGEKFERWIAKCLIGLAMSGNIYQGDTRFAHLPPPEWIEYLFGLKHLVMESTMGLYLVRQHGAELLKERGFRFAPLFDGACIAGAQVHVHGIRFELLLYPYDKTAVTKRLAVEAEAVQRPAGIRLLGKHTPAGDAELTFVWTTGGSSMGLELAASDA